NLRAQRLADFLHPRRDRSTKLDRMLSREIQCNRADSPVEGRAIAYKSRRPGGSRLSTHAPHALHLKKCSAWFAGGPPTGSPLYWARGGLLMEEPKPSRAAKADRRGGFILGCSAGVRPSPSFSG